MEHQEMIQPTNLGVVSRTCLFALFSIAAVLIAI